MSSESRGYYRGKSLPDHPKPIPEHTPLADARQVARAQGYTGNICSGCGGVHMQMAGHCEVCSDCGTTTGCS